MTVWIRHPLGSNDNPETALHQEAEPQQEFEGDRDFLAGVGGEQAAGAKDLADAVIDVALAAAIRAVAKMTEPLAVQIDHPGVRMDQVPDAAVDFSAEFPLVERPAAEPVGHPGLHHVERGLTPFVRQNERRQEQAATERGPRRFCGGSPRPTNISVPQSVNTSAS